MHVDADIAIVGSGFSGSIAALALRQRGQRVVLVERGRHPRFAIGESSTPLANLLIEELADRYDLPRLRPFSKWGTWQRTRPDVACGLKRGFTFYFHRTGEAFTDGAGHARQLLVAASPHDEIADTHWYRPDFDHALVREAQAAGAIYLDETRLDGMQQHGDQVILDGSRNGRSVRITAGFVIDASGPRGFLHRALNLPEAPMQWLPHTHGLYSHFEDVELWDDSVPNEPAKAGPHVHNGPHVRNSAPPPYPPDEAALHHVFPGGWIWVLRFNNGFTSAGAALTDPLAAMLRASEGAAAWDRLLEMLPSVQAQFRHARPVLPFVHAPRLAFRSGEVAGGTWALLPSAAGVIDPLLSTGFPLTLLGLSRLLEVLERTSPGPQRDAALQAYARVTQEELDVTEQLVAALYATMDRPAVFKRLSLLYFAAASYSEAARRIGRPALAPGFLLHGHPHFGAELRMCAALAPRLRSGQADATDPAAEARLLARIDRAIEPFDVAGFLDRSRDDWYPVRADDLIANASKLEATTEEVHQLLARSGFASASHRDTEAQRIT